MDITEIISNFIKGRKATIISIIIGWTCVHRFFGQFWKKNWVNSIFSQKQVLIFPKIFFICSPHSILSPFCRPLKTKGTVKVTRGFIPRMIQWHIQTGWWSLVNWWHEALTRHYIRGSWILMRMAVGLMDGMALMVIGVSSVIPRHFPLSGQNFYFFYYTNFLISSHAFLLATFWSENYLF